MRTPDDLMLLYLVSLELGSFGYWLSQIRLGLVDHLTSREEIVEAFEAARSRLRVAAILLDAVQA